MGVGEATGLQLWNSDVWELLQPYCVPGAHTVSISVTTLKHWLHHHLLDGEIELREPK